MAAVAMYRKVPVLTVPRSTATLGGSAHNLASSMATLLFAVAAMAGHIVVVQRLQPPRMCAPDSRASLEAAFRKTLATEEQMISSTETETADLVDVLTDMPLWRVQWPVLPGFNQVLHVHVPHYCHSACTRSMNSLTLMNYPTIE